MKLIINHKFKIIIFTIIILSIIVLIKVKTYREVYYENLQKEINVDYPGEYGRATLFDGNGSVITKNEIYFDVGHSNFSLFNDGDINPKEIKYLYSLTNINYSPQNITNIDLSFYNMENNNMSNINLSPYNELEFLGLYGIEDCSIVSLNSSKLKELEVQYSNLENINNCGYFEGVSTLNLGGSYNFSLKDLSGYDNLKKLYLDDTEIDTLESLENMESIEKIYIDDPTSKQYYITDKSYNYIKSKNIELQYFGEEVIEDVDIEDIKII